VGKGRIGKDCSVAALTFPGGKIGVYQEIEKKKTPRRGMKKTNFTERTRAET